MFEKSPFLDKKKKFLLPKYLKLVFWHHQNSLWILQKFWQRRNNKRFCTTSKAFCGFLLKKLLLRNPQFLIVWTMITIIVRCVHITSHAGQNTCILYRDYHVIIGEVSHAFIQVWILTFYSLWKYWWFE